MGWPGALDLVIAMPVSWLPLVADYARFSKSPRGALTGTWAGYAVANVWCYALGLLVVLPAYYGGNLVFAYIEMFPTPRQPAEVLVLAGLIAALRACGYLPFADTYINTIFVQETLWRNLK